MKKKIAVIFLSICLVLTLIPSVSAAVDGEYSGKIVILHSNDVHGAIDGYAYIAGLRDDFESKGARVILADAGDYSQGSPYVSTKKGEDAVTMMNAAHYDVAGLGNHEFDYGYAQLKDNMTSAHFKVLCANIIDDESDSPIFDARTVIDVNGTKIGFFALDTPETSTKANPALIRGLSFLGRDDLYDCAQEQINALEDEDVDVIVCIAHLGVDDESKPNRSYDLLENVEGIDIVLDGHSHTVMESGDNGEPIQSTGTKFENVGVVIIDEDTASIEDHYLIKVEESTPKNTQVAAAAEVIKNRVDEEYNLVFAQSEVELNGAKAPGNRTEETNLGDLITDSMRWVILKDEGSVKVDADNVIALTNGGGIRAPIHIGEITKKDVNTVLPFGNTVTVIYVKGSVLLEALEASTYCTPGAVGGFPQVSGMKFTIDTDYPYDANDDTYPGSVYYGPKSIKRVTIDEINGKPFDENATYAVITNDFVAAGGDTYYAFANESDDSAESINLRGRARNTVNVKSVEQFDTGRPLDEVLMQYITEELGGVVGSQYENPQGRITVLEGHELEEVAEKEPTCTTEGCKSHFKCKKCGKMFSDAEGQEELSEEDVVLAAVPDNHVPEIQGQKDPTCTEDGYTGDEVCAECGEVLNQGAVIPATGHDTEIRNAKEPTCDEEGYTGDEVCKNCGEIISKGSAISATGHKDDDKDGKCDVCGEAMPDGTPATTGDTVAIASLAILFVLCMTATPYIAAYNRKKRNAVK